MNRLKLFIYHNFCIPMLNYWNTLVNLSYWTSSFASGVSIFKMDYLTENHCRLWSECFYRKSLIWDYAYWWAIWHRLKLHLNKGTCSKHAYLNCKQSIKLLVYIMFSLAIKQHLLVSCKVLQDFTSDPWHLKWEKANPQWWMTLA